MEVTLQNTEKIVELVLPNGAVVSARIWEGQTADGIKCHAYITRIAVHDQDDAREFERDLQEMRKPSAALAEVIPARLIL